MLCYPLISLLRRLLLGLTCVYLKNHPLFSILSVFFHTLFMICTIGLMSPYSEKSANRIELFNETCVILLNYHLICFTDFVQELYIRDWIGNILILVTILNVAVNLFVISLQNIELLSWKAKLFVLKILQQREIKKAL